MLFVTFLVNFRKAASDTYSLSLADRHLARGIIFSQEQTAVEVCRQGSLLPIKQPYIVVRYEYALNAFTG